MKHQFYKMPLMKLIKKGFLEKNCGIKFNFDIFIHYGSGAYVCGEETALIESLEGKKVNQDLNHLFPANVGFLDNLQL